MRLRPYRAEDRPAVLPWVHGLDPWVTLGFGEADWDARLQALAGDTTRDVDVAELDGRVVGLMVVRRAFLFGDYLETLAVAPDAQRRGVGRALLTHAETRAFGRSQNFFLCVSDFNAAGRAFYERCGYTVVGLLPHLVVAGHDEILMRKSTGPARGPASRDI